ncbi:MAG: lysozyme [Cyanobacteria bacterium J06621_8]
MNKYINGTVIVLISTCTIGLTTIAIGGSKINKSENNYVRNLQLQMLNDSLVTNLKNFAPSSLTAAKKTPPVSSLAINIVKEFEGFKDHAYIDTDGTPVIGYGLSRINGRRVSLGDRINQHQAHQALNLHLEEIHQELARVVEVPLNEHQLSALASISFNVGVDSIKESTLLRKINTQDYLGAANEFLRWDKANLRGRLVRLPGLTRRRQAERKLFLAPSNS